MKTPEQIATYKQQFANNNLWNVKSLPEVKELDAKINSCVHQYSDVEFNNIQNIFWKTIEAIQKKVNYEQPIIDIIGEDVENAAQKYAEKTFVYLEYMMILK